MAAAADARPDRVHDKGGIMSNIKSILAAGMLAAALAACSGTPTRESTGEFLDDAAITAKVKTALVEDKQVKASDVAVNTFRGTVELSGFADNPGEIDRAVEIARRIAGVKAVRNDIGLKTSSN
jgi:hyperosmotically inducible protein